MADGSRISETVAPQSPAEWRAFHAIRAQQKGVEFTPMSSQDALLVSHCIMTVKEFDLGKETASKALMRADLGLLQGSLQLEYFKMSEAEWEKLCGKYGFCSIYRDYAVPEAFGISRDASRVIDIPEIPDECIQVLVRREIDKETIHPIMHFDASTAMTEIPLGRVTIDMFGIDPMRKIDTYLAGLPQRASEIFAIRSAVDAVN